MLFITIKVFENFFVDLPVLPKFSKNPGILGFFLHDKEISMHCTEGWKHMKHEAL